MTTSPTRRSIVKGAVWSAPVVLATTAIPAYAASPTGVVKSVNFNPIVYGNPGLWDQIAVAGIINTDSPAGLTFTGSPGGTVELISATVIFTFRFAVKPTATPDDTLGIPVWTLPTDHKDWGFTATSNQFTFTLASPKSGTIGATPGTSTNFAGFTQDFNIVPQNPNPNDFIVTITTDLTYRDASGTQNYKNTVSQQFRL